VRTLDSHPKVVPWVLGKPFYVVKHSGPCCATIAYFVGRKEGRIWFNKICLKLYQFDIINWWCLSVLKSTLESLLDFSLQSVLKSNLLENILKKNHGLPKFVSSPSLGGGHDENSERP
jgi:hypothetical protein